MRVRWTAPAANDLARIVEYIRKDDPAAARRVAQRIYKGVAMLQASPRRGRAGLVEIRASSCFRRGPMSPCTKSSRIMCWFFAFGTRLRTGRKFEVSRPAAPRMARRGSDRPSRPDAIPLCTKEFHLSTIQSRKVPSDARNALSLQGGSPWYESNLNWSKVIPLPNRRITS